MFFNWESLYKIYIPYDICRQSQLEAGSSSIQDEAEDVEELPLVRHRRRRVSSVPHNTREDIEEVEVIPPSSPQQHDNVHHSQHPGNDFPSEVPPSLHHHQMRTSCTSATLVQMNIVHFHGSLA